jgi:cold shock CspA family protein
MKDAMTDRSPSAETIRFVVEILSARQTPLAELPQTITAITQALGRLNEAPDSVAKPAPAALERRAPVLRKPAPARKPAARPAAPAFVLDARPAPARAAEPVLPEPVAKTFPVAAEVATPVAAPRRGRPRKVEAAPEPVEEVAEEVAPPQPRLLRRADALASEAQHHTESAPVPRAPEGTVRGVVKWFDGRAGKGALRLTGISGDVMLDPAALARSGIKRLYKDQEVEATVEEAGGRVRLLSLSLPTRSNAEPTLNLAGEITGTLRRQPRAIQVQIKRDGIRQSAARAEAEQVLGGVGRIKASRRLTP